MLNPFRGWQGHLRSRHSSTRGRIYTNFVCILNQQSRNFPLTRRGTWRNSLPRSWPPPRPFKWPWRTLKIDHWARLTSPWWSSSSHPHRHPRRRRPPRKCRQRLSEHRRWSPASLKRTNAASKVPETRNSCRGSARRHRHCRRAQMVNCWSLRRRRTALFTRAKVRMTKEMITNHKSEPS